MSRTVAVIIIMAFQLACGPGELSDPAPIGQPDPSLQFQQGGCGACAGCCQDGVCVTGNTQYACGLGGLQCRVCGGDERCEGNTCQPGERQPTSPAPKVNPPPEPQPEPEPEPNPDPDCGPDNCDGCCDLNGKCQDSPVLPLCGEGGYKCDKCTGDQTCGEGVCEDKPVAKEYTVVVVSAKISGGCEGLLSWINECDPLVRITFAGNTYKTKSDDGDDTPDWNQPLFVATDTELTSEIMMVEVLDEDSLLTFSDDKIGKCSIEVTSDNLDDGSVVTNCGDAKNLTIAFQPK